MGCRRYRRPLQTLRLPAKTICNKPAWESKAEFEFFFMSVSWPKVRLGEVLTDLTASRTFDITPEQEVIDPTIKSAPHTMSVSERSVGASVRVTKRIRIVSGDIVFSRLHTQNGAFAFSDQEYQATGTFVPFSISETKVDKRFLFWALHVRVPSLSASDTVGRETFKTSDILALEIPLPPLSEQRRIVARIEALAAQIAEARSLRQKAAEEAEMLMSRETAHLLDETDWTRKPLGDILAESPRNGLSPKSVTESGGRSMLRINAVSSSLTRFVDLNAVKNVAVTDNDAAPFELQPNDVFIVRYNGDINRVAKPAIFKADEPSRTVFPDKLMRLRPILEKMIPDFLVFALSVRSVREQIEELGKTTAGNIGVSGANAKSFVIPVPPLLDQRRIVAYLDGLQAQVDALKKLQAETAAELAALLPSILDRAFKGGL